MTAKVKGPNLPEMHARFRAFSGLEKVRALGVKDLSHIEAGNNAIRDVAAFNLICRNHKIDPYDILNLANQRKEAAQWLASILKPAKQAVQADKRLNITDAIRVVAAARRMASERRLTLSTAIQFVLENARKISYSNSIPLSKSIIIMADYDGNYDKWLQGISEKARKHHESLIHNIFIPYDSMVRIYMCFKRPEEVLPRVVAEAMSLQRGNTWAHAINIAINNILEANHNA
jgi:hypothetical protein